MCDPTVIQCECENLNHAKFDAISSEELGIDLKINDIVNESYCVMVSIKDIDESSGLSLHETLVDLKSRMGVYALWIDHTYCYEHDMHRMLCLYVGKGYALGRIKSHIKDKWPETQLLYITFYECKNRIAKYAEQLMLDIYDFPLNKDENQAEGWLATIWSDERHSIGTHLHEISDRLAQKFPETFQ